MLHFVQHDIKGTNIRCIGRVLILERELSRIASQGFLDHHFDVHSK